MNTTPTSWQILNDMMIVVWSDGHESYYSTEQLRRDCPCAICSGEPDLFGRMAYGAKQNYRPESFQVRSVTRIGNYAIQPNFADGHTFGIWTHERLRAFCPCAECRATLGDAK